MRGTTLLLFCVAIVGFLLFKSWHYSLFLPLYSRFYSIILFIPYRRTIHAARNESRTVEATNPPVPRQPIEYYLWEDGVSTVFFVCSSQDYDRLCHILVNRLNTSSSGYTLTLNANRGGLGHKQVSFMLGISYALLLGRRLQSRVGCES